MKRIGLGGLFILLLGMFILPIKAMAISKPALSNLIVEGIGELDVTKTTHNIKLTSTLGYAEITADPASSNYKVEGDGRINCQEGNNEVTITVTDPSDNSTQVYTININYVDKNNTTETENPNTGDFINYIYIGIIGIAALGLFLSLLKRRTVKQI